MGRDILAYFICTTFFFLFSFRHWRVCQWSLSERWYLCRSGQRLPVSVCTWLCRPALSDRWGYILANVALGAQINMPYLLSYLTFTDVTDFDFIVWFRCGRVCQRPLSEQRYLYRPGQRLPVSVCTWLCRPAVSNRYVQWTDKYRLTDDLGHAV